MKFQHISLSFILLPSMVLGRFTHRRGDPLSTLTSLSDSSQSPLHRFPFAAFFDKNAQELPQPSKKEDNNISGMTAVDAVQVVSTLLQTAAFCFITIRIGRELLKLIRGMIDTIGQSENSTRIPPSLIHLLKPNTTLNAYEVEMSNSLVFPNSIEIDFKNMGGLKDVKRSLLEASQESSQSYNISDKLLKPVKAVLLYGPPGCGKTSLVQALCKRLNRPLLQITPSSLLRKYVGETSQLLRASFSLAAKIEPCVIFVDEMDSLFRSRRDGEHEFDRNLKTEFMQLWDTVAHSGDRVLIIGATNRPQDLDSAIQRRFERSYLVGPPDRASRAQIFRAVLKDAPTEAFDFDAAADLTKDYTPSDIVALCRAALQIIIREHKRNSVLSSMPAADKLRSMTIKDINEAMASVFPTTWVAKSYGDMMQNSFKSNSDSSWTMNDADNDSSADDEDEG